MKILMGTKNPGKIEGVKKAFEKEGVMTSNEKNTNNNDNKNETDKDKSEEKDKNNDKSSSNNKKEDKKETKQKKNFLEKIIEAIREFFEKLFG